MGIVVNRKTKTALGKIVRDGLSAALSSTDPKTAGLKPKVIATISSLLVDHLMVDTQFIDCMSSLASEKTKELLTTEDAARLSGFSRPLIIALLDGDLYPGTVMKTPKGHRRVERGEFVAWLKTTSVPKDLPKTIQDVRSGPRDEEPMDVKETKAEKEVRRADRAKRLETARSMGIF